MTFEQLTDKTTTEIFALLKTQKHGLSSQEAEKRAQEYGRNEITTKETTPLQIFLRQFASSFIYLLLGAAALALFLQEFLDAGMIILFVTINSLLGFYQEYHSQKTLSLLKQYITKKIRVKRDQQEQTINSNMLVPGDIVLLQAGDMIPADIRIVQESDLMVDESVLTGEAVPVRKSIEALPVQTKKLYEALNLGFSGTTVVSGKAEGIVFATGAGSVIGDIAKLTTETNKKSVFEKDIRLFSTFILRLVVITLCIIFFANVLIKGTHLNYSELLIFSIALAVSVIPEALPVVTTFCLSRGALRLAKHKVVVKRLSAIEDLGSIEVLCADKTGTLTENKLTIAEIFSDDKEKMMHYALIATQHESTSDNGFNLAIKNYATEKLNTTDNDYTFLDELPFDPQRKRSSILVKKGESMLAIIRGAAETIVPHCHNLTSTQKQKLQQWIQKEGSFGRRTLALAVNTEITENSYTAAAEEKSLTFIGMVSFVDPIKQSAKSAITKAEQLGVQIKILTGDSKEVAAAVGKEVGLIQSTDDVITGDSLDALSLTELHKTIRESAVFARVNPQQKYKIIQILKETYEVGFLGEGINDAPALKIANVALVVQGASDIAKEAADIVLLEKSLTLIVDGIKEGREIFTNTVKYIRATLSSNFGNFYAVAISSLLIPFLPMLPIQLLLVNLLTDFPMIAVATDSVDTNDVKRPKGYNIKEIVLLATMLGCVSTVFDFIIFALFSKQGAGILQTNWFMASVLTELVFLYSIRTKILFFKAKRPSNILLVLTGIAFFAAIILPFTQFGEKVFRFVRPTTDHFIIILLLVCLYFITTESVKLLYYHFFSNQSK